jgi:hypothetical protein
MPSDQRIWEDFIVPYLKRRATGFHNGDRFTAYGFGRQLRFRVVEIQIDGRLVDYGIITKYTTVHCQRAYTESGLTDW